MHTTRRQFLARTSLLGGLGLLAVACGQTAPTAPPSEAKPTPAPAGASPAASPAAQTAPAAASPATAASPPAASPAAAAPAAPARPVARVPAGEITVALPAKVATLDPHGAQSVEDVAHTALQHVMEPLVRRDAGGNLVPALATEWKNPVP